MKDAYVNKQGFTIVELLIVIVVVAILAAISIATYSGISDRANDSVIKNDLASFAKAAQLYYAEQGVYPPIDQLSALNLRVTKSSYDIIGYNLYYCTDGGVNSKFAFAAKSKSGNNFYSSSAGSGASGTSPMFAVHACNPIAVAEAAGNLTFAYHRLNSTWSGWAH